jgi:hypothetical protein
MSELPIACTLSPEDLRQRRAELLPGLLARAVGRETLAAGMQFQFEPSSETLAEIMRVIDAERQCCRFLQFELSVTPDLGPMVLTLSGPPGTLDFLSELVNR